MKTQFGLMTVKPVNRWVSSILVILLSFTAGVGSAMGSGGGGQTTAVFIPNLPNGNPNPVALSAFTVASTFVGGSSVVTGTLFDAGRAPLTINTITISGAQAADFSLSGTCANGAVIVQRSPGVTSCLLQITFTPKALGRSTAVVDATFVNALPLSLTLTGDGLNPNPEFITNFIGGTINFGSKTVGTIASLTTSDAGVSISNPGGKTLLVSSSFIGANPGDFAIGTHGLRATNCHANIVLQPSPQLTSCIYGINFLPTRLGTRTATLRFTSNDPLRQVLDIPLSGVGTPAGPPPPPPPVKSFADFTDLWGVAGQTDWSIGITHHKATTDALVAFWHTYDVDGRDMWLELKDGHWVDSLTFTGTLHRPTGSAFSVPDNPNLFLDAVVGTATLKFTDASHGTFSFNVNGAIGSQIITRVVF